MSFAGAAFLRGINVGGHTVTNDRLREVFEDLGLSAVTPYLASGNVTFIADSGRREDLVDMIEAHLLDRLGFEAATFVRSRSEIVDIADYDPFGPREGKMHVGFLDAKPDPSVQDEVRSLCQPGDEVHFRNSEMYWHVPGSFMDSALSGPEIGRILGKRVTVRTARTVERLAARLPDDD